jgi:hypothetical protein
MSPEATALNRSMTSPRITRTWLFTSVAVMVDEVDAVEVVELVDAVLVAAVDEVLACEASAPNKDEASCCAAPAAETLDETVEEDESVEEAARSLL